MQMSGVELRAGTQGDGALEVLGVVLVIGNGLPVSVEIVQAGVPPGGVPLGGDASDAVGSDDVSVRDGPLLSKRVRFVLPGRALPSWDNKFTVRIRFRVTHIRRSRGKGAERQSIR